MRKMIRLGMISLAVTFSRDGFKKEVHDLAFTEFLTRSAMTGSVGGRSQFAVSKCCKAPILVRSPIGCATYKWKLSRRAFLPVVFKLAIQMAAAESQDRVGSSNGPEHSRPFETESHHRLATSFNDARTNK